MADRESSFRIAPLAGALLVLSLPCALPAGDDGPVEAGEHAFPHVGRMFRQKCQGCHTVPDSTREFDRAWLDQVKRTA